MAKIKMHIPKVKLPFYPPCEVKCRLQNGVSTRDNSCVPVIEKAWNSKAGGSEFRKLYKKQAATRDALRKWNKEVFGRCQDRINSLIRKIKEAQVQQPSQENEVLERSLQAGLSEWLSRSETL